MISFQSDKYIEINKSFFILANCRKLLDSGKITEHDGEMFCGSCYSKNFGPKGYGFGGGSGTLSMDDGKGYQVIIILWNAAEILLVKLDYITIIKF